MTDAPERTYVLICGPEGPLSERLRWVNCICGRGMHDGGGWDLNTQCGYCDDADEVAALEQERADLIRERNETPSLHMAQTIRDLRAAIREKEVDIEALCQLTAIVCARPEGNGYVPTDEEKTLLLNHAYRLRARTEGENDAND